MPLSLLSLLACAPVLHIDSPSVEPTALPPEVRTLAIVDRVEQGDSALAVEGLRDALRGSATLRLVHPRRVRRVLADAPLDGAQAERLCAATGASGVIGLEGYQLQNTWSDPRISETIMVAGPARTLTETGWVTVPCAGPPESCQHEERVAIARYEVVIETRWRVSSCLGRPLLTRDLRTSGALEGRGARSADARDAAGDPQALDAAVSRAAGASFAALLSATP